jgi:hypothetical protein
MDTIKTQEPVNPADEIWAILRETDRIVKENALKVHEIDRQMRETDLKMQETDRIVKATAIQMQETDRVVKETALQMKETDRQMKETDRQMKETDRKIGERGNRFGELAEHLVAPGIVRRFNELGYHFDDIIAERVKITDGQGRILTEIDLLMENRDYSVAVEVKTRPRASDIEHHLRRMELLREHKDRRGDRRKVRGAIAGAVFPQEEKEAAAAAGLYVIEQSGDTMKLSMPADFVPLEL